MNSKEAKNILRRFYTNDNPTKDDEFSFIEACQYLIETENDNEIMVALGGYYYDKQKFQLAEKYYLMAFENGNKWAPNGLGYIYYYGRTGERDYKKAFYYYSIAKENGELEAAMKIADMYRNGYGVEKDETKYKSILLEIYEKIKDTNNLSDPYPEVAHRLAEIYIKEGHPKDALEMLIKAKSFIEQRIRYNPFWGNFIVCRRVITLLYQIIPFDDEFMNFFDLFYALATPHKAVLLYEGKRHIIESFIDEGELRVKCDDKYYKSIENFLMNALFEGEHTYVIEYEGVYTLEVIKWKTKDWSFMNCSYKQKQN